MGILVPTVALVIGTYLLWSAKTLITNIQEARRTGLPVVVLPIHSLNPFFLLTMPLYKPIITRFPFGLSKWKYLHFLWCDWALHTSDAQFEHYGDLFIIASPGGNYLHVGDAGVSSDIMSRRVEFPKDIRFYEYVRLFGDSVLTVEGHKWRKHRKITNPPFSEAVNSSVWKITLTQTKELLHAWIPMPSVKISRDIRCITRNVISDAGFGVTIPFSSVNEPLSPINTKKKMNVDDPNFGHKTPIGHILPYGQALDWLLDNLITTLIIPSWIQRLGPSSWRKTAESYDDTGLYIKELLERERKTNSKIGQKKNLLGALVATSDSAEAEERLSEEDIMGNVFVFAVAGLQTTAGTLQYALTELALNPDKQRWLHEELEKALDGESEDPDEWDYNIVFPKLVAPMCIIHETLRLHPTFQSLPKWSGSAPQTITYKDSTYIVPPETSVFITLSSLHYKRKYWGDSVNEFAPEKWDLRRTGPKEGWSITDPKTSISTPTAPPQEVQRGIAPYCHLRQPLKGSYIAFAEGYRQCLGKNFALVEMSALLGVLFRHHRVEVARREGETKQDAIKRAYQTMRNSGGVLTTMMKQEVELRWERR